MIRSETRWIAVIADVECVFPTEQQAIEAEQEYIRYMQRIKRREREWQNS